MFTKRIFWGLVIGILILGFSAPLRLVAQESLSEANYRIFSTAKGIEVSLREIAADMASNDVLFFG